MAIFYIFEGILDQTTTTIRICRLNSLSACDTNPRIIVWIGFRSGDFSGDSRRRHGYEARPASKIVVVGKKELLKRSS